MSGLNGLLMPRRGYSESWGAYKARRSRGNAYVKRALRGRLAWNSAKAGTYRKEFGAL